jgi:hypothetical protein
VTGPSDYSPKWRADLTPARVPLSFVIGWGERLHKSEFADFEEGSEKSANEQKEERWERSGLIGCCLRE